MKRILAVAFIISLFLIVPHDYFAKGATTKIIMKELTLQAIEITDRKRSCKFQMLDGAGNIFQPTGVQRQRARFIVDWSQGPVTQRPKLSEYQVSFYSDDSPNERPFYVVYYASVPAPNKVMFICLANPMMVETEREFDYPRSRGKVVSCMEYLGEHKQDRLLRKLRAADSTDPTGE